MANSTSSTTNPSGVQGACPTGWHLPSNAEWTELIDYLGGENGTGGKLKETGRTHWNSPNTEATNETGFTALPGGCRHVDDTFGTFAGVGETGFWWSATEGNDPTAWIRQLEHTDGDASNNNYNKELGFSIRCVKD